MVAECDVLVPPAVRGSVVEYFRNFEELLAYKIELLQGVPLVPSSFRFDLWCYRTPEEARVGRKLHQLSYRVPSWQGIADYHQDAILWELPRLPVDYETLKKAEDSFWADTVRVERRTRARYGVLVQWHQPEAEGVISAEHVNRWPVVPT